MIQDLSKRSNFWRDHHAVQCQGDSIARPFEALANYASLFRGRSVLEIGPGEGRQSVALRPLARSYAIADIVPAVLKLAVHEGTDRHLIRDYAKDDLGTRFDVVCFWYVLHHILRSEADAFLAFIMRHLKPGGVVLFNAPHANPAHELADHEGNGLQTTPWTPAEVETLLARHGLSIERSRNLAANCLVLHAVPARVVAATS